MKNMTLQVGQIVNTHGLRGEVKIVTWTNSPDVFETLSHVYTDVKSEKKTDTGRNVKEEKKTFEKEKKTLVVTSIKYQKGNLIVKFKGIDTIDEAQKYKNKVLYVNREQLGEPEEGYYICDLIGCNVFTDGGQDLGKVCDVFKTGSNSVYAVRTPEGKQILLPEIDEVVLSVDIENDKIIVHIIDGLLD